MWAGAACEFGCARAPPTTLTRWGRGEDFVVFIAVEIACAMLVSENGAILVSRVGGY